MSNFLNKKQQKERGYSVNDAIESVQSRIGDTEDIVIMTVNKDGAVDIDYSTENTAKLVGCLEIIKHSILENL